MAKKVGRPTKLTPSIQKVICEGLEVGMSFEQAALRAGVTDRTRFNWVSRGEAIYDELQELEEGATRKLTTEEASFLGFFLAHTAAVAESQFYHLSLLENHAQIDPRVSQWILENRFPETFKGNRQRVEHTGRDGGAIQTEELSERPVEETASKILAILSVAEKRKGSDGTGDQPT